MQRKAASSPLLDKMIGQIGQLSTYPYSGVRARGQLALLSCCRRYQGAVASALPRLIGILGDSDTAAPGHDQRVIGAAVLLQTRYFQCRILRDWSITRRFLLTLCQADYSDKDAVIDALDGLFSTFLSYWYQVSLDMPPYTAKWECPPDWSPDGLRFDGYANMFISLAAVLRDRVGLNWRFKLMIIDAVTVMLRDDTATPLLVWQTILDGMVSDIAHIREACYPALGSALELLQTGQQSKEDRDQAQTRFPDKAFFHCNGPPPATLPDGRACAVRTHACSPEYVQLVLDLITRHFEDPSYLDRLISALSIIQLGRAKSFVGSHAQMFKGLFKALGPRILRCLRPFLDSVNQDPQAHTKMSSDVFMGKQCLAAEVLGGLVRGAKYWSDDDRAQVRPLATMCHLWAWVR